MRRNRPERASDKKARVTLLGVIANGSTREARNLLKKYNQQDAKDYTDLEYKLTKLYRTTDDKIQFEKDLAEIHPHKDFIKKYCVLPIETEITVSVPCRCGSENCPSTIGGTCPKSVVENKSNAGGCSCCGVDGSCQPTSNASGIDLAPTITTKTDGLMVLGILGIISIFALTLKS